jgi:hypothetical protein
MHEDLNIEIRFLERHYRDSSKFECCVQVTTEGDIPYQLVYPLAATWDAVLLEYPTIEHIKQLISWQKAFQGWTFGKVDVFDAKGLY